MSKVSLKTQNITPLSLLMLSTLLVAHFVTIGSIDLTVVSSMSFEAGLLGIFGAACVLLSYLIPAEWKHKLDRDALPGHRFIKLSEKDLKNFIEAVVLNLGKGQQLRNKDAAQEKMRKKKATIESKLHGK